MATYIARFSAKALAAFGRARPLAPLACRSNFSAFPSVAPALPRHSASLLSLRRDCSTVGTASRHLLKLAARKHPALSPPGLLVAELPGLSGLPAARSTPPSAPPSSAVQAVRSMGTGKKIKSYSSYKRRFKLSPSTGKYTRRRSGSAHLMTKKSKTQKRRLRLGTTLGRDEGYGKTMRRLGFKLSKYS